MCLKWQTDLVISSGLMKRAAHSICFLVAWLALASQLVLSGVAAAGAVTCFGLDGHIGAEWPHPTQATAGSPRTADLQSVKHGPCVDVVVSGITKPSPTSVLPTSGGDLPPASVAPGIIPLSSGLLAGAIIPTAPPSCRGASAEFCETIRLLI